MAEIDAGAAPDAPLGATANGQMRFHNGYWWYPTDNGWLYYNNGMWMTASGTPHSMGNFRWNDGPARGFNNISALGTAVPMHIGEAYDQPGTALVPPMRIEDFRMTSISPAV